MPPSLVEYRGLLEWTVAQVREGGVVCMFVPPSLARVGIAAEDWVPLATRFGRLFQRVAGAPRSVSWLTTRRRIRCRQAALLGSG